MSVKKPAEVPEDFMFWNAVVNGPLRNTSSHSVLVVCRNVSGLRADRVS